MRARADTFTISPDGTTLVISDEKHISLINLSNNTQQILATHPSLDENFMLNMVFNTDGTLLATRKSSGETIKIELWDMGTHTLKNTINVPETDISSYFFVPNTSLLVIVGFLQVFFWDVI